MTAVCLAGTIVCGGVDSAGAEATDNDSQSVVDSNAQTAQALEQKVIELYELGVDHEEKGRYSAARLAYEEIFVLFKSENLEQLKEIASRTPALESAIMSLVEIYWAEGTPEKAVAVYSTIIPLRVDGEGVLGDFGTKEEHESLAVSYSEERTGALIAQSIDSADEDPALVQKAFSTALVKKSRVLDAIASTARSTSENISPQVQSELDTLYRELANLRLSTNLGQSTRATDPDITTLEDKITKINIELLRKDFEALEWLILPPPNSNQLEEIQDSVPDNAALVEIIEYTAEGTSNNRYYAAYVLTKQGGVRVADLGSAAEINNQVAAFRQALQTQSARSKTIGQQLDRQIMQPIRSLLKDENVAHLLIAPDSHLNTIPFEAFVDQTDNYLIESYQISYVASGKDLFKADLSRSSGVSNSYRLPFVIVADPDYDTASLREIEGTQRAIATAATNRRSIDFETLSFPGLPGTLKEATLIENLIPEAIFLTQDEPTENIVKQIRKPFILHFATHGFFLADSTEREAEQGAEREIDADNRNASLELVSTEEPQAIATDIENPLLRAGLALTGANNPGNDGEDGILTALEVSEMDLHGTELVVLSACETGLGAVSSGEGVYGMRRAFTMAGAASQVLSLWQVDDTGTSELMSLFYENLTQKRQGRSEALRNAQLELLNTGTYQHPYYWSSFILSGNWRPLATDEELELERQREQPPERNHKMRSTTANFNLAEQIEEYKESRAWRDKMLAEMLALGDQRRYDELAEKREAFNRIMDERTNPDLFRLSITLLENLQERMEDLYIQERYAEAIEVAETTIEIQESGTEEIGRFDLLTSWSALAFLQRAQGADDITMLMTYRQILSVYEDLNE